MNILIPDSWLREYLQTNANPKDIQNCLSLCGPSVERLTNLNNDWIYDIEVTTNRVDCMSVLGIAREAAVILPQFGFDAKLTSPKITKIKKSLDFPINIISNPKDCHRVMALYVKNVTIEESPEIMAKRLGQIGVRSLNNLVDITNYLMWETGHPIHVFDADLITTKKMIIREAESGDTITTLDGKTYELKGGEVVIDDGTGNIIDLPSIMGTANSMVNENTKNALFFIDDIDSKKVRFASMTHNIRTQAATLMEKDVHPKSGDLAISKIIENLKKYCPKSKINAFFDDYSSPQNPKSITISPSLINSKIGIDLSLVQITKILSDLGFKIKKTKTNLNVTPPFFREYDIQIPEDIVEEIARIYGYLNIPSIIMPGQIPNSLPNKTFKWENKIKTSLKYLGFNEVYTYSLVSGDETGLTLKNQLSSDWAMLRTALVPSHQAIISENLGRQEVLNFFEIANVYLPQENNLPTEQLRLIISTTQNDYYLFKGQLETFFDDLGISKRKLNIITKNGFMYFEESLELLLENVSETKSYLPSSKYSPIYEDINVLHNKQYEQILTDLYKISPLISDIKLIDRYQNKLTLRITFHSDQKQLSVEDIEPIRHNLKPYIFN